MSNVTHYYSSWKKKIDEEIAKVPKSKRTVGDIIEAFIADGYNIDREQYREIWDCECTGLKNTGDHTHHIPEVIDTNPLEFCIAYTTVTQVGSAVDEFAKKILDSKGIN